MKCSDSGIEFIKQFEGFRSTPYNDVGGKPTVGYGHLVRQGERFDTPLSDATATALLCDDLLAAEACIEDCVDVTLTQPQFDALCSFTYNLGCVRLRNSTLLRYLNRGIFDLAADELLKWNKVGLTPVAGLSARRAAEREMFLS